MQMGDKVILYSQRLNMTRCRHSEKLRLEEDESIILIDARSDNKPSGQRRKALR